MLSDVSWLARTLEEEKIRLHPEDAILAKLWMDRLKDENVHVFYKDKLDPPPLKLRLQPDMFVLCIQTHFQLDAFRCLSQSFIRIDATHNTTQYQDLLLFTIVARDRWGHCM